MNIDNFKNFFIPKNKNVSEKEFTSIDSSYFDDYTDIMNGTNPSNLVGKKGMQIFDSVRKDEQVKAAMGTKKYAILSTGWDIHPASDKPEHIKHQEFIKNSFTSWMSGSFNSILLELCTFMDYGFVVAEKNYTHDKGVVYLKNIKVRAPHTFKLVPDEFGNITDKSIIQQQKGIDTPIPRDKTILYTYRGEFGNPFGKSDYEEIYRSWFSKDVLIKFENIYLEKFGTPSIILKVDKINEAQRLKVIEVFQRMRNASVATLPKSLEYEIINVIKGGENAFKEAISRHDASIAKGILMPNQLGFNDTGSLGSNAKAKTQFDVFLWVIQAIRDDMEEGVVNEQIIKQLIYYNFGEQDAYPQFKFNPMTEKDLVPLFELWNKLVEKGSVKPTKADEDHIRKSIEFPERDDNSELLNPEVEEDLEDEVKFDEESNAIPPKDQINSGGKGQGLQTGKGKGPIGTPKSKKEEMAMSDYPITKPMEKVNFKRINDTILTEEDLLYTQIDDIVERISIDTIDRVENKQIVNKKKMDEVDKFNLKYIGDLKLAYKKSFIKMYNVGIKEWKSEQGQFESFELLPEEYMVWLNSQAFMLAGQMGDSYKAAVKKTLLAAINGGWSEAKTTSQLSQLFARIKANGAVVSPTFTEARLKMIIRTNLNTSFNKGRYLQTKSLAKKSKSPIYRLFSEVMAGSDQNSHPVSKIFHGKYVLVNSDLDNRLQYPFHYNERGIDLTIDSAVQDIPKDQILTSMPPLTGSGLLIS